MTSTTNPKKPSGKTQVLLALLFWLGLWQALALMGGESIFFTSPLTVLKRLAILAQGRAFWQSLLASLLRISGGFFLGLLLGSIFAVFAYYSDVAKFLLRPLILCLKAVPLVSFIILCLIFLPARQLALLISALMVLPLIYTNVLSALESIEKPRLELAFIFELNKRQIWRYIYMDSLKAPVSAALKLAAGLAWKSGVAAEVIGTPQPSIGEALYKAKIYLDTADLFAWTLALVLLSLGFEKLILLVFQQLMARLYSDKHIWRKKQTKEHATTAQTSRDTRIVVENLSKSYGGREVIKNLSFSLNDGEILSITGPSGSGKTTLIRLLMGLEEADTGQLQGLMRSKAVVFQEDLLCENFSTLSNIALSASPLYSLEDIRQAIDKMGLAGATTRPVWQLSGGMRRRVALLRALLSDAEILFLDEPFAGLDEDWSREVFGEILRWQKGRSIFLVTHKLALLDRFAMEQRINLPS